jgi:hypothetical protein
MSLTYQLGSVIFLSEVKRSWIGYSTVIKIKTVRLRSCVVDLKVRIFIFKRIKVCLNRCRLILIEWL